LIALAFVTGAGGKKHRLPRALLFDRFAVKILANNMRHWAENANAPSHSSSLSLNNVFLIFTP
jgi:hypothetical protein